MLRKLTKEVLDELLASSISQWTIISYSYELSEDFIRQYQDKVEWCNICFHQKLSEDFIIEFKDKIIFDFLICNKWTDTYSIEMQKFILQNSINNLSKYTKHLYSYMTPYMKEQYEKLSIML